MKTSRVFVVTVLVLTITIPVMAQGDAAKGEPVYMAKCKSCHGADGSGATPMGKKLNLRDLRSPEVQKQSDQQLFDITAKSKDKMPSYAGKLSDEQIKDLVAFMRKLK